MRRYVGIMALACGLLVVVFGRHSALHLAFLSRLSTSHQPTPGELSHAARQPCWNNKTTRRRVLRRSCSSLGAGRRCPDPKRRGSTADRRKKNEASERRCRLCCRLFSRRAVQLTAGSLIYATSTWTTPFRHFKSYEVNQDG